MKDCLMEQQREMNEIKEELRQVIELNVNVMHELENVKECLTNANELYENLKKDTRLEQFERKCQIDISYSSKKWNAITKEVKNLKTEFFMKIDSECEQVKETCQNAMENEHKARLLFQQDFVEFKSKIKNEV